MKKEMYNSDPGPLFCDRCLHEVDYRRYYIDDEDNVVCKECWEHTEGS